MVVTTLISSRVLAAHTAKRLLLGQRGPPAAWVAKQSRSMPFSAFARGDMRMEVVTIKVPTMGDSITEGTIVEWTTQIGEAVSEGDVVALVETDKVTVDIKAETDGVLVARFGDIEDTVEVGAELYQIDTEATASPVATNTTTTSTPAVEPSTSTSLDTTTTMLTTEAAATTEGRIPSIRFLGKHGWKEVLDATTTPTPSQVNSVDTATTDTTTTSTLSTNDDPMYGRPVFSEEEMEALMMGGANIVPQVTCYSSGAQFQ